MDVAAEATRIAKEEGVDPALFLRLIHQESGSNPQTRKSSKGATGLTQLMPDTAREMGVNPNDPIDNLRGGARYLRRQLNDFGDPRLALAAYNAGPGAVRKAGGIPNFAETKGYVASIMEDSKDKTPDTPKRKALSVPKDEPKGMPSLEEIMAGEDVKPSTVQEKDQPLPTAEELGITPVKVEQPPSNVNKFVNYAKSPQGREIALALGGTLGGVAGGVLTAPAGGEGAIPGAGIGAATAGKIYDIAMQGTGNASTPTLAQNLGDTAKDVIAGGAMEVGGQVLGKGVELAAKSPLGVALGRYGQGLVDAIPISLSKPNRLAQQLKEYGVRTSGNVAQDAADLSARAGDFAQNAGNQATALFDAAKNSIIPKPSPASVGAPKEDLEIGQTLRSAGEQAETGFTKSMTEADKKLREIENNVYQEFLDKGNKIEQLPIYKVIQEKFDPIINWKAMGDRKPDSTVEKVYKDVAGLIFPQKVKVDAAQAAVLTARGKASELSTEGNQIFRTVSPTFSSVNDARRWLGTVFSDTPPEGYAGISANVQRDLYKLLDNLQEEIVGEAHPNLQANWREGLKNLEAFKTNIAKTLVGKQTGTDVPRVSVDKIPDAVFKGKGVDDFDQLVKAVGGNTQLAVDSFNSYLAKALDGKTYEQAAREIKNLPLLNHPALAGIKAKANRFLMDLGDSEGSSVTAKAFADKAKIKSKAATSAAKVSAKAKLTEAGLDKTMVDIAAEPDLQKASKMAFNHFESLRLQNKISPEEYDKVKRMYQAIDFDKPIKARQDLMALLKKAGYVASGAAAATYGINRFKPSF
jgi:hypothetical protein